MRRARDYPNSGYGACAFAAGLRVRCQIRQVRVRSSSRSIHQEHHMKRLLALALLSACASKVAEPKLQTVDIPKSAEVYLNGRSVGKTPMMVVLDRKKEHHVQFQQEGYQAVSCTLEAG